MFMKSVLVSDTAAVVISCLPGLAAADDVHIIKRNYPDSFKMQFTMKSTDVEDTMGEKKQTDLGMVASAQVNREGAGYKATYRIDDFKMQVTDASGKPQFSATETAMIGGIVKAVGVAKVTMNANLEPVSVDNIDEIKASMKAMLTAPGGEQDGKMLYDMMIANQTPESAAQLINQSNKATSYYDIPLTLNKPVSLPTASVELMGTPFRVTTVMTLTSWEEGKKARLHYVMEPSKEDADIFMKGILTVMMAEMTKGEDAETQAMMARMADHTKFTMTETCDAEVDLVNPGNYSTVCDNNVNVSIDLKAMMAAETQAALPVITIIQTSHKTTETKILP